MTLFATARLEDALDATVAFLDGLDAREALALVLVGAFLGGPPFANVQIPSPGGTSALPAVDPDLVVPLAVGLLGAVAVVTLGFLLVGSVMEFVLLDALVEGGLALRPTVGERWRLGLRLFGFRLLLGAAFAGLTAGMVAVGVAPFLLGVRMLAILTVPVALMAILALVLAHGLVEGLTVVFVVPIAAAETGAVLPGWRRLVGTMGDHPWQFAVYLVVGLLLSWAERIFVGTVVGTVAAVVVVPLAIGGLTALAVLPGILALAVVVLGGLAASLVFAAIGGAVRIPATALVRYHALLVLGDLEPTLDLVPDRRSAMPA